MSLCEIFIGFIKNKVTNIGKNKKKVLTANLPLTPFFVGGPTWTRTRDQLIMSQLL